MNKSAVTTMLACLLSVGCSTTSTFHLNDGSRVEGHLSRYNDEALFVDTGVSVKRIDRDDVNRVDKPGTVATVVGVLLGAYGVANADIGQHKCNSAPIAQPCSTAYEVGVWTPLALGVAMTVWGLVTHSNADIPTPEHH
jgi:hypothetical protein